MALVFSGQSARKGLGWVSSPIWSPIMVLLRDKLSENFDVSYMG